MDSFEKVLPRLVKLQLFSDFDIEKEEDCRILKAVYDNLAIKTFKAGQTIIREGETGDSFFILYSGEVLVSSMTPAGDSIALATLSDRQNILLSSHLRVRR